MSKVLVIRLSSFGDVVMLVPVIYSVAARYPRIKFSVLTRSAFAPLFDNLGFNVSTIALDPREKHKGLKFLKIFGHLTAQNFTHVIDEHDVLRSKVIRAGMRMTGKKVYVINKGRKRKNQAIKTKVLEPPLPHTINRYIDTFKRAGFPSKITFTNFFEVINTDIYQLRHVVNEKVGNWIGIAPFSRHEQKNMPLEKMEKVVEILSRKESNTIFLFAGSKKERALVHEWTKKYPNVRDVAKDLNLIQELLLIYYLDVMVSMDSANMHLASLVEVPVVSVWGATHPNMGFYGFGQDKDNAIQIDIACRPCSIYGEVPCARGDLACLTRINEQEIILKVNRIIERKNENKP